MKAIVQERYGSPDDLRLGEVPEPTVGDDEVLVRVRAASLHPDVWHMVAGRPFVLRFGTGLLRPKNRIPGTDMAGVVEATGRGVTRFQPGDEVFGETQAVSWWTNGSAFAELVAVPQDCLAQKPANVSFEQAASVPASGFITLLNLPDADQLGEGKQVLINGAGGGVGTLALQIVKSYGARVTAVDTTAKLDMLRALGADRVIDYTREDFTRGDRRYDLIFDIPGDRPFSTFKDVLTPSGKYVPIGHESYGTSGRRLFGLIPHFLLLMLRARFNQNLGSGKRSPPTKKDTMKVLRDLLAAGKITPVLDSTYPLSEIHEAFRHLVEDELHGKVILTVP
jgi:NADPH:quinone reductase-like Zn-dependent oxidoreductase